MKINNIGRRGEGIAPLIAAIIAGVVLLILFISAIPWIAERTSLFKFKFEKDRNESLGFGILRYDLTNGELKYYDGTDFLDFEGKRIKLIGKIVDYSSIKSSFENYVKKDIDFVIYDGELKLIGPKKSNFDVEIKLKQKDEITKRLSSRDIPYFSLNFPDEPEILLRYITKEPPSLGWEWAFGATGSRWLNTYFDRVSSCKLGESDLGKNNCETIKKLSGLDKVQGLKILGGKRSINSRSPLELPYNGESLVLTSGGDLYKGEIMFNREFGYGLYELLLKDEAQKWRDSVLKKPIGLSVDFGDNSFTGPPALLYICPELIDEKYIIVRLDKEASATSDC